MCEHCEHWEEGECAFCERDRLRIENHALKETIKELKKFLPSIFKEQS